MPIPATCCLVNQDEAPMVDKASGQIQELSTYLREELDLA